MKNLIFIFLCFSVSAQELQIEKQGNYYQLQIRDGDELRQLGYGAYKAEKIAEVLKDYGFRPPHDFPATISKIIFAVQVAAPLTIAALSKLTTDSWIEGFNLVGWRHVIGGELVAIVLSTGLLFIRQPHADIENLYGVPSRFENFEAFERDLLSRLHSDCSALNTQPLNEAK